MTSLTFSALLPALIDHALPIGPRLALVRHVLSRVVKGRVTVVLPGGERLTSEGHAPGGHAELRIVRWRALTRLAVSGDVGFAEAYVDGDWDTPDLAAFLGVCADNADRLVEAMDAAMPVRLARRAWTALRRNSRPGSRRNIMAHYDLGNGFFARWLCPDMIYSSALYADADDTLETAQARKLARIADLLRLDGSQDVLEIGCGWGGLAAHLAHSGAASVHGVTISPAQLDVARERVAGEGLEERVRLDLTDYRDLAGQYDRIVSIEMFEAVGEAYWATYFDVIRRSLKPGGRAVLQVITIHDDHFEHYRAHPDMIQTMVFPGGMLPSKRELAAAIERGGLKLTETVLFGPSYARTLADWRHRFEAAWPDLATDGFTDAFRRLWRYYLAYCEVGFATGRIDVGLYVIEAA